MRPIWLSFLGRPRNQTDASAYFAQAYEGQSEASLPKLGFEGQGKASLPKLKVGGQRLW